MISSANNQQNSVSFLQTVRRIAIFVVGFSLPFNQVTIDLGRAVTVSVLCVLIYFLTMLKAMPIVLRINKIYGNIVLLPFLFFVILTFSNITHYNNSYGVSIINSSLFWCLILYYFFLTHQYLDDKALKISLSGLAIGGIVISLCFVSGYQVSINEMGRLTVFDENTNALGIFQGISTIIILNEFVIKDFFNLRKFKYAWLLAFPSMLALVMASGSRSAFILVVLSAILTVFFFPTKKKYFKVLLIILGSIVIYRGVQTVMESDAVVVERLLTTIDSKDSSGREDIVKALLPAIWENPILGCGDTGYIDISRTYIGELFDGEGGAIKAKSPHNVLVETLILTGFVGFIVMVLFWIRSFKESWGKYKVLNDPLYILLIIPVLICLLSGQLLLTKWAYLLYAFFLIPKRSYLASK